MIDRDELSFIAEAQHDLDERLETYKENLAIGTTVWYFSTYSDSSDYCFSGLRLSNISLMKGVITKKAKKIDIWPAYVVDGKCWEGEGEETIQARNLYLTKGSAYQAWLDNIMRFERLPPDEVE